jgi:methionine-rich copper-binding protein CopC
VTRQLVPAGLAAALALWPAVALAHAVLVKSVPAQRASLVEPPPRIELWFNERLEPAYSKASVTNEAGTQVDLRDVAVSTEDPRRLSLSLPPLKPGRYTVNFRVLSVDGHVVESRLSFTVKDRR